MEPNGEYDYRAFVAQSERLQQHFMEAQAAMADAEVVGRSPNGQVVVTVSASGDPRSVRVDPVAVDPGNVAGLEKQIVAALADIQQQMRRSVAEMMGPIGDLFGRLP